MKNTFFSPFFSTKNTFFLVFFKKTVFFLIFLNKRIFLLLRAVCVFYTHCSNQIVPNRPKWFQKRFLGRTIEKKLYISVNKLKKCNFFWKRLKKNKKTHFFRLKTRKNEFKWLQIDITKWFQIDPNGSKYLQIFPSDSK